MILSTKSRLKQDLSNCYIWPGALVSGLFLVVLCLNLLVIPIYANGEYSKSGSDGVITNAQANSKPLLNKYINDAKPWIMFNNHNVTHSSISTLKYEYNLLYKEAYRGQNIEISNKKTRLNIASIRKNSLTFGGLDFSFSKCYISKIDNSSLGLESKFNVADLYLGYLQKIHCFEVGAGFKTNLESYSKLPESKKVDQFRYLYSTSSLDLQAGIFFNGRIITSGYVFDNSSMTAGTAVLQNEDNGNERRGHIDIDRNQSAFYLLTHLPMLSIENALLIDVYGGETFSHLDHYSLRASGDGVFDKFALQLRSLPNTPEIVVSLGTAGIDMTAEDNATTEFAKLKNNRILGISGTIDLKLTRRFSAGILHEQIRCENGEGLLESYPFTSWTLLFDIPDKLKVKSINADFNNSGINLLGKIPFCESHSLGIECAVTYCEIKLDCLTADLVRYMGLLPVYRNEASHSVDKRYVLANIGVDYKINTGFINSSIQIRQLVPIELKERKRGFGEQQSRKEDHGTKKRVFGGFSLIMQAEFGR